MPTDRDKKKGLLTDRQTDRQKDMPTDWNTCLLIEKRRQADIRTDISYLIPTTSLVFMIHSKDVSNKFSYASFWSLKEKNALLYSAFSHWQSNYFPNYTIKYDKSSESIK